MIPDIKKRIRTLFRYMWGYMGTLAAMGLLVGVLGMGIYHTVTGSAENQAVRCYSGLFNSSDATEPTGIDELPATTLPAVPHLRFEYGKNGRLERLVHISAEGHPIAMPGSRVAEQRMEYDEADRLVRKCNYTATGEPTVDASGVHARVFRYDEKGRLVCTEFQDRSGQRIVPRMPGYAMECIQYDVQGRPLRIDYRDGKGEPITNTRGEQQIIFAYDDEHNTSTRTNFIAGAPADNAQGIAREEECRTADGRSITTTWFNAAGEHAHQPATGACSVLRESTREGTLQRERYCDDSGTMCRHARTCAERLVRTTPQGLVEWECYNDADGIPCVNEALGYAERVCEYGQDGALLREYFWDENGNPCTRYEKRYTKSPDGKHVLSLLADGSTELRRMW